MKEKKILTRGTVLLAIIILLAIISVVVIIKTSKSNSIVKYKEFEEELKIAAENYYAISNIDLEDGEEKKITIKKLSDSNLIYNDLKDKCSGYVIMSSEEDISTEEYNIEYRSYIKCGNKYMTTNYSEY